MDSRDGLPRGALPSGILKIEKYCPGLEVPVSNFYMVEYWEIFKMAFQKILDFLLTLKIRSETPTRYK